MIDIFKKDRLSLIFGILFVCSILGWLLYAVYGHQVIEDMCLGKSIGLLNSLIKCHEAGSLNYYTEKSDIVFHKIIFPDWLSIIILAYICLSSIRNKKLLERHTDAIDAILDKHVGLYIGLAAALGLYVELLIIRFHSSYFQLFAYFKNISLLSCFLGLGVGYARGPKRLLLTPLVIPLLVVQFIILHLIKFSMFARFLQNPIKEQVAIGLYEATAKQALFTYGFLLIVFLFNALCFIPLGQLVSRLMARREKNISYNWNLAGSLLGIALFTFLSFIWMPPSIWIVLAGIMAVPFIYNSKRSLLISALSIVIILIILALPVRLDQSDIYSPYQILTLIFSKDEPVILRTSNTYYQRILDLRKENIRNKNDLIEFSEFYEFPYYLKHNPENVLVIGSGTGNDVASALRNNAKSIDAVEIDPAIIEIGRQLHPESPYQDARVRVIVDDARAFIKSTNKKYDIIVYGLLDAHTLLASNTGGIRLDSYVYTVEAFKEARSSLKDDGIICLAFCLCSQQIGRKLYLMLEQAFDGEKPVVYEPGHSLGHVFLAGNNINRIKKNALPLKDITPVFDDINIFAHKSTDDWPFFYMPVKKYPMSYAAMLLMLFIASIVFIYRFSLKVKNSFSMPCFFLGAGFMLIETKGITELSLAYGSTWVVVSIVIAAILIMAFLANLLVMRTKVNANAAYVLLFISVIIGLTCTYVDYNIWATKLLAPLVLTLPLFFSGLVFSAELKKSVSAPIALSSNLLGAMFGGFLEYNSMYFGFRSLYIFALIIYGLSFLSPKILKSK